jgi:hypothetical protein
MLVVGLIGIATGVSGASTKPGTAKQVAALVAAAPSIKRLPKDLTPPLASANEDNAYLATPSLHSCTTGSPNLPACVYGDTHGSHTMVLFGDSHAFMWFPAVDAIAKAAKWKLVALMSFGCPVADVTVWNIATNSANTECPVFRAAMIKRIDKLNPSLVVVTEGFFTIDANKRPITDPEWTTALEKSLAALHSHSMKKVLIGNTMLIATPNECLTVNPTSIQTCSRPENTTTFVHQRAAEQAAAKEQRVPYVNEIPWTCSATCTVVIGNMLVYNSPGHLSSTYDTYLSGVLTTALKPSM